MESASARSSSSNGRPTQPLSPRTRDLFKAFTTLYDDDLAAAGTCIDAGQTSREWFEVLCPRSTLVSDYTRASRKPQVRPRRQQVHSEVRPNSSRTMSRPDISAKQICFDAVTGTEAILPKKRSAFSDDRRLEVKKMRGMGACLRCQLRKRSVRCFLRVVFQF